jgi:hypothetical protein
MASDFRASWRAAASGALRALQELTGCLDEEHVWLRLSEYMNNADGDPTVLRLVEAAAPGALLESSVAARVFFPELLVVGSACANYRVLVMNERHDDLVAAFPRLVDFLFPVDDGTAVRSARADMHARVHARCTRRDAEALTRVRARFICRLPWQRQGCARVAASLLRYARARVRARVVTRARTARATRGG